MLFGYFILFVALLIESVGAYYSITGLAAIFSGAFIPIVIMGLSLEIGKVTAAVWLKNNWRRLGVTFKLYLLPAVLLLMIITSIGIFGFLSKAHSDQSLVSGDVSAKLAVYDQKIQTAQDTINRDRKQLAQMDAAVDQVLARSTSENGAERSNSIRRSQRRDRDALNRDIEHNQQIISDLNDQSAPIRAESRKAEADVGPIKYIAKLVYSDNPDANLLERAVVWVIIIIVAVFDPLALTLILAANKQFEWARSELQEAQQLVEDTANDESQDLEPATEKKLDPVPEEPVEAKYDQDDGPLTEDQIVQIQETAKDESPVGGVVEQENLFEDPPRELVFTPASAEDADRLLEHIKAMSVVESDDAEERPGDYVRPRAVPETAPGRNRGRIYSQPITADNDPTITAKPAHTDFGNTFPDRPARGDVYLRTDFLPNKLFKFNGVKWMEVDKSQTDVYAYDEMYIKYLIAEIDAGRYDADTLTDVEREQIQRYLER